MNIPRLPLEGKIDLTYRCNCDCRHCWVRMPADHPSVGKELSFDEIARIVGEARAMGCRRWSFSGGEPMLRQDFTEIFDRITRDTLPYSINTNGTFITPDIARLLKRKGVKMIALYGATEAIHDHVTRTPGSFAAVMRGFNYLREAGVGFVVQIIPMRDNRHEFEAMVRLASTLSPTYRVGAPWIYMTACRSASRNREIARQRIDPTDLLRIDPPDMQEEDQENASDTISKGETIRQPPGRKDRLFAACVEGRREFHIDPYGGMTFCGFITDPSLRYDLRKGNFREAWEEFIPSLGGRIRGNREYRQGCGRCAIRSNCRWCPAYGYLEHGRYTAKIAHLCELAEEERSYRKNWLLHHRQYFRIAGMTIQVDSDLPFQENTLNPKFEKFRTEALGKETIYLRHHFSLPKFNADDMGQEVSRRAPWAIFRKDRSWIYLGIGPEKRSRAIDRAAIFNEGHTRGRIFNSNEKPFRRGNLQAITMFPSDQIILAMALADRQACYLHAAGMDIGGKGFLFVGHSETGKTTAVTMLREAGTVLCDDRIIVRNWPDGMRIHGTWSHGDLADVSAADAPLCAIFFLEKAGTNRLVPVANPRDTARLLVQYVVRSLATPDWWRKILAIVDQIAGQIPAYRLQFDKSGRIRDTMKKML